MCCAVRKFEIEPYNKSFIELAFWVRVGKILVELFVCKFMDVPARSINLQKNNSTNIYPVRTSRYFNNIYIWNVSKPVGGLVVPIWPSAHYWPLIMHKYRGTPI